MEIDAFLTKKAEMLSDPMREFFYRLEAYLNPFDSNLAAKLLDLRAKVGEHLSQSRPDAAICLIKEHYADFVEFLNTEVPPDVREYHRANFNALWAQVTA